MFAPYNVFFILLSYLLLLFGIAWVAERQERRGRSLVNNPYVYSLSLAVYCTSWTFYGSVGRAATSGLSFLTIYLGPTLMAALWMVVLTRIVRIAKANRITTISDFLGFRYGKSLLLSGLVAAVAVIGVIPYIGLQIKAIISTFEIISHEPRGGAAMGLVITLFLGGFAIIFGARRLDASERHGGLVFAVAFESLVKLVAFLLVGVFVTYGVFDGFGDIFARIDRTSFAGLQSMAAGGETAYSEWFALLVLSMMAILFLPRQFQMAVVENCDERHLKKAVWLFPLYLFLINIFVLPIAFAGLLLTGSQRGADYFVLSIPLGQGMKYLSLMVFLGGFSAATSMVIVESLALSTMAMNSIVMPTLIGFHEHRRFPAIILTIKRVIILAVVYLGYLFAVSIGEFYSLVDIGLKSFEAVALFAPAFLLGLYWKRGSRTGAIAGLCAGFAVWFYTLIIPALFKAGILTESGALGRLTSSGFLDPNALFGLHGLGKWGNSLFWSMFLNLALYVGISLATRPSREEEIQALLFVESDDRARELPLGASVTAADIEDILAQYVGADQASGVVRDFVAQRGVSASELIRPGAAGAALRGRTGALGRDRLLALVDHLRGQAGALREGALGALELPAADHREPAALAPGAGPDQPRALLPAGVLREHHRERPGRDHQRGRLAARQLLEPGHGGPRGHRPGGGARPARRPAAPVAAARAAPGRGAARGDRPDAGPAVLSRQRQPLQGPVGRGRDHPRGHHREDQDGGAAAAGLQAREHRPPDRGHLPRDRQPAGLDLLAGPGARGARRHPARRHGVRARVPGLDHRPPRADLAHRAQSRRFRPRLAPRGRSPATSARSSTGPRSWSSTTSGSGRSATRPSSRPSRRCW